MTVTATLNLRNGSYDLLPHLVAHLAVLGVARLIVCVNTACLADHEGVEAACVGVQSLVHRYALHDGGSTDDDRLEDAERAKAMTGVDGWIMPLDLDEFHEYPVSLSDVIAAAEDQVIMVIKGRLIDRFVADGTLAALRPTPSVWEQYPVANEFTRDVLGGYTQKVMLHRDCVPIGTGHHNAGVQHGVPVGCTDDYRLHHFKWRAGLIERIRHSIASGFASDAFTRESAVVLDRFVTVRCAG